MNGFIERMVERLRQDGGFSRNRHYQSLSSPEGRLALRIHRHLRSIERDLRGGWSATVTRADERVCLTLRGRTGRRVAYLTPAEFRILRESPAVREMLGDAA